MKFLYMFADMTYMFADMTYEQNRDDLNEHLPI